MSAFDNGDSLIDELVQAIKDSVVAPKNLRLLKRMGTKRRNLEKYIFRLENRLDIRSESGKYDN